ncbi:MAG TPA: hypothetical protein VF434_09365 [Promineifilum sp.]
MASTLRPLPSLLYILPEGWQSIFGDLDGDGATEIADQNIDKQKLTIHDAVSGVFERDLPISVGTRSWAVSSLPVSLTTTARMSCSAPAMGPSWP